MTTRHLFVALAPLLLLACGGSGSNVGATTSAEARSDALSDGANGSTYVLTSFDGTSEFIGLNNQGKTFTAVYGSTTSFKAAAASAIFGKCIPVDPCAPTDPCWPVDPCRVAAAKYSCSIQVNDTVGFNTALTDMVTFSCKAKVLIDQTSTIKTFQPAP